MSEKKSCIDTSNQVVVIKKDSNRPGQELQHQQEGAVKGPQFAFMPPALSHIGPCGTREAHTRGNVNNGRF